MESVLYVAEAADALKVPQELMVYWHNFDYDPFEEEWVFDGITIKGHEFKGDMGLWAKQICTWLQDNYPQGPVWPEECCC